MSRLRRLCIHGIRNFDEEESPELRFSRPLTLILGPNGTGKTTIIECLKYVTCGEFPPNSQQGKSFVRDPSLSNNNLVRGGVKAEIFDADDNLYTISRAVESSRILSKSKIKTLDSALSRMAKGSNEPVSITHRCANVDEELLLAMGVSKPILNYVIFCHQEDVNWPFEEGKKLKERFDEIFDSAKYNKALDNLIKLRKTLREDLRVYKIERDSIKSTVMEATDREEKLADHQRRLQECQTNVQGIIKELVPISQKIQDIEDKHLEYKSILAEQEKKKAEYDICKSQVIRLKQSIREVFGGTTEELNTEIENYDAKLLCATDEIDKIQMQLKDVVKEELTVSGMLADERIVLGTFRQQLRDQEAKITKRDNILNEALSVQDMGTVGSRVSELEVIAYRKRLEEKMREVGHWVERNRMTMEEEERKLQKEVDSLRTEHSKLESEKSLKEDEIRHTRCEIDETRAEIENAGTAASKLSAIEVKIQKAKDTIDMLNKQSDVDAAKKEVQEHLKLRDEIETNLNSIDEEIGLLLKQSSLQAELELQKTALLSKQKEIAKLKKTHEESIKVLLDVQEVHEIKLKNSIDKIHQELVNETKSVTQEMQSEERVLTTLETTVLHDECELQKKKNEIELGKEQISVFCNYKEFDETLVLQSKRVKDLQDKRGMYAHQGAAYKEYMKKLKEKNPCCPLCHRGFHEEESVVNLLKEMESEMINHPNRLKQCEIELRSQQETYDTMLQLKPVLEKVIHLEDVELEKLNENLRKTKRNLEASRRKISDLETRKKGPENRLTRCKEILGDIMLWDRCIDEISKLKEAINISQNRLAGAGIKTDRSLEEAQVAREKAKMSLKDIGVKIEDARSKINTYNDAMQNAKESQNTLHAEQLKLQASLQNANRLKDKIEELYAREIFLRESVDDLRGRLIKAESELNSGINTLEKQKRENRVKQEQDRKKEADGNKYLSELRNAQDEVENCLHLEIPNSVKQSEKIIDSYQKSVEKLLLEKSTFEKDIQKKKEAITYHEVQKRELSDNLILRKNQDSVQNLRKEFEILGNKLQDMDYSNSVKTLVALRNREENLLSQKHVAKGKQEELEWAVQQYTEELKKDMYRQARKRYKKKTIEVTVQEHVILDLQAYSKALDVAMLQFHEERIATVNRIMKELWKLVYIGSDTTSIKIHTDATEGVGSDSKRSFNYKLVQTKHGHEMDMKGRCSAGQKALASIILRLALAETFCKECGILALDEPTTNLDEENATSLANALAKVIKVRSQRQKNFQLIVISHDEKFLLKLAHLNKDKGYYELYRTPSGYTSIAHSKDKVKEEGFETMSDVEVSAQRQRPRIQPSESTVSGQSSFSGNRKRSARDESDSSARQTKKRYVFND